MSIFMFVNVRLIAVRHYNLRFQKLLWPNINRLGVGKAVVTGRQLIIELQQLSVRAVFTGGPDVADASLAGNT